MATKKPRKTVRSDDPEQSKRFIEMGKELGADKDGRALSRAFKRGLAKSSAKKR